MNKSYTNADTQINVTDAHAALPTPFKYPDSEDSISWGIPEVYHIFETLSNMSLVGAQFRRSFHSVAGSQRMWKR